jgi:hypothetical protein
MSVKTLREHFKNCAENENLDDYDPNDFADRMMQAVEYYNANDKAKIQQFAKWLTAIQTDLINRPASKTVQQRQRRSALLDAYKLVAGKFEEIFDGGS